MLQPKGLVVEACRRRPTLSLLDRLALVAVFLQTTELYRPLGFMAGFSTSLTVNVIFLLFFVFYLVVRHNTLLELHSGVVVGWALALSVVPTCIMGIQLLDDSVSMERVIYWSLFCLIFALLMLTVVVLWAKAGPDISTPFFVACIAATWVGFAVNWLDYDFLREVMAFSSNPISASKRTIRMLGFYPHPNAAALALTLYFACLACARRFLTASLLLQIVTSTACLVGVLVTGSRTSLILLLIVFVWYVKNVYGMHRGNSAAKSGKSLMAPFIPVAVAAASFVLLQIIASSRDDLGEMLALRTSMLADLLGGTENQSADADTSLTLRVSILSRYLADIAESPLLGRGPDFASSQIQFGNYTNVSQNSWLEWAIAFGVPYVALMALMLTLTYRLSHGLGPANTLVRSYARLVLLIIGISTFSVVNPFWARSVVCVVGALLGSLLYASLSLSGERRIETSKGVVNSVPVPGGRAPNRPSAR